MQLGRRFTRWMKWLVLCVALAALVYPAVGNLFLQLGGVEYAFASTDQTKVKFGSAWTLWPGTVHVSNLWIMIKDYNVQCVIQIEDAELDLSLWELTRRKFHATRVRANGVLVRARHRVTRDQLDQPQVEALPPLPGLNEPPVFIGPEPPPIPDNEYDLWSVQLDNVDAQVREVWIQQVRYVGSARVRGGFQLKPARELWVGPASLELEPGTLSIGTYPTLHRFAGRIETTIVPFDVRPVEGMEMLTFVSASAKLDSQLVSTKAIKVFSDTDVSVHFNDSPPHLAVNVAMDRGAFRPNSEITLRGEQLHANHAQVGLTIESPWALSGRVIQDDTQPSSHVGIDLNVANARAIDSRFPHAPVSIAGLHAAARSDTASLEQNWQLRDARVTLDQARIPKLAVLNRWLPVPDTTLHFEAGSATLRASARYTRAQGLERAMVDATLKEAAVSVMQTRMDASGALQFELKQPIERSRQLRTHFDLSNVSVGQDVHRSGSAQECAYFHATRVRGELDTTLVATQPHHGELALTLDTAVMRWGDFKVDADANLKLTLAPTQELPGARSLVAKVDARKVRLTSGAGAPENWHAAIPKIRTTMSLEVPAGDLTRTVLRGSLSFHSPQVDTHIGTLAMRLSLASRFRIDALRLKQRSATLRGTTKLTRGRIIDHPDLELAGWWARIRLRPTSMHAQEHLDLNGAFSVKARDGMPALLMLAERGELPGWVPDVMSLDAIDAQLRIARRCRFTDLQITHAVGGGFAVTGRLQNVPGVTTGALQAEVSGLDVLSLGVVLTEEGSELQLFATDAWTTSQQVRLQARSVQALHKPVCAADPEQCGQPRGAVSEASAPASEATTTTATDGASGATAPNVLASSAP